jgi:hypothetical protein
MEEQIATQLRTATQLQRAMQLPVATQLPGATQSCITVSHGYWSAIRE